MSFGAEEARALTDAVRRVARAEILPRFRALAPTEIDQKSGPQDLVTVADLAAERALTAEIAGILPGARVVGEEAVSEDPAVLDRIGQPGLTVVLDPIDGTWNYANGVASFGVILAVLDGAETIYGLLYDPGFDDWVEARAGEGAWFGRPGAEPARLRASEQAGPRSGASGYLTLHLFPEARQRQLAATLPGFARTGWLRCSCHEYRMMAQGRVDFTLNAKLNVWDHAAGVLALREAGGVARLLDGRDYEPVMREGQLLTAGTDALWSELAVVLAG